MLAHTCMYMHVYAFVSTLGERINYSHEAKLHVNQLNYYYNFPVFIDMAPVINIMDECNLSNKVHHGCLLKYRKADPVLAMVFIRGAI